MAFTTTVTDVTVVGNRRLVTGTLTQAAGDSGGTISTGLSAIDFFDFNTTSHVGSTKVKYTISGGDVTLVIPNDVDGLWMAIGR
jgi:hypothetical protein